MVVAYGEKLFKLLSNQTEASLSSIFEKFFQTGATAYFARHPIGT